MASPVLLCVSLSLTMQAAPIYLEDKTRYDEPEIQNPYGPSPKGPNPHGRDPHDEIHDNNMPANNPDKYYGDGK